MTDNTASSGQLGAGQQDPSDSSSEVNKIAFAVSQIMARFDFMKPVKVIAVHAGSGSPPGPMTVDVQPLVQQIDGNRNAVSHGIVYGIPVSRTQGGKWTIICDPAVDDVGYVVAGDRDMSKVKATAAEAPPGSLRKFKISDGVYAGAILGPVTEAFLWLKADGTFKLQDAAGFVLETDGSGNGTITGDLNVIGNVKATQDVWAASASPATKVTLKGHISVNSNTPPTPGH